MLKKLAIAFGFSPLYVGLAITTCPVTSPELVVQITRKEECKMKINRLSICVLTAAFFLTAAGAFGSDSPAPDANRKTLDDAGFKCEQLNGGWSCSKDGEKHRGCDNDGKCSISPGSNANRKTLQDAGFKCEKGGVADWGCSKPGEKDRTCDNEGNCF